MKLSHLEPLKLIVEDAGEGWTKETATVCLLHSSSYEQVNVVHMIVNSAKSVHSFDIDDVSHFRESVESSKATLFSPK